MLEGRGIDFESIGMAIGYRRDIEALTSEANANMLEANRISARHHAIAEGRRAQIQALYDALVEADPDNPALRQTGLFYADGQPEIAYEQAFGVAYDAVAKRNGIPPSQRAMTHRDRAYAAVMAEPIRETNFFFTRRYFFRDEEHRNRAGAERARQQAAKQAREAVDA